VRNAADLRRAGSEHQEFDLAQTIGDEPTPEFAAIMADECRRLLGLLDDPELAALALAKMEGYRNREIADQRGVAERTIERQLKLIRIIWERKTRDER
jgi:DNA-directed RNA polymerase specialized sigma24 family protein